VADEEEKPAEAKEGSGGSSNKGLVVVVLIAAVVLGGGAAAAGAVVAIRMGTPPPAAPAESAEGKPHGIVELSPIVVDIRAADGTQHHLKVALSAELAGEAGEGEKAKEEMASILPRGREAAITYLRSLSYEDVTAQHSFEKIKEELSKRLVEALGEKHVVGVLVTDFVAQ
jgi:flagellar basal body-associated protein FliL